MIKSAVMLMLVVGLAGLPAMAWTAEQELTPGYDSAAAPPSIAVDAAGKVHCIYPAKATSSGNLQLYYRSLTGTIWSNPVDLPSPNRKETQSAIAVGADGRIHVLGMWRLDGTISTPYSVFYWEFDGATWLGPTMLSDGQGGDNGNCGNPQIAIDGNGDIHTLWSQDGKTGGEGDILYRKRQGGAWQAVQNMTANNAGTSYGSSSPDMAVDPNGTTVHVVWHDDFLNNGFQAYYTKNTNLGASNAWLPKTQWFQLSTGDYGKGPHIALDAGNNPHVWWTDRLGTSTNRQAYRRWTGTAWSGIEDWGSRWFQAAAIDSTGVIRYLYVDYDSDNELYYTLYSGGNFSGREQVSTGANTLKVDGATLCINSTNVFALWEERKGEWPGHSSIYFSSRVPLITGPTGTIDGYVQDQYGTGVAGATVSASGTYSTLSQPNGFYSLIVPPGTYSMGASKAFYTGPAVPGVTVTANQTTSVNLRLDASVPNPVSSFVVEPGNTLNHLSWRNPSSGNFTGTLIRFRTDRYPADPGDGQLLADRAASPSSLDSMDHTGLTNGLTCYYAAFAHGSTSNYAAGANATGTPAGPGDYDRDGDVDQNDFGHFQACLTGATVPQYDPDCQDAKFDGDTDVDPDDFARFMGCWSGPGVAALPGCFP